MFCLLVVLVRLSVLLLVIDWQVSSLFFFFQAEDGIRDWSVTGVQTCALPIYKKGVHFIGLVNVQNLKAGGLGSLGQEQLEWMEKDVKHLSKSTPIVVFAHIPLWSVYPEWGWGTEDSAQALAYLKKFGSVSVLNGHIHQIMQKVEGNVTFHTAMSTAFPQPEPGKADSPGPMKVPAEQLRDYLGISDVKFVRGKHALAIVDSKLSETAATGTENKSAY